MIGVAIQLCSWAAAYFLIANGGGIGFFVGLTLFFLTAFCDPEDLEFWKKAGEKKTLHDCVK